MSFGNNIKGDDIKRVLNRINKLKLSKLSEDLLFQVLFTNAYSPKKNLSSDEFLQIKINWLINKKRIKDLETLLKNNPEVGQNLKAIKFLTKSTTSVDVSPTIIPPDPRIAPALAISSKSILMMKSEAPSIPPSGPPV